MKHNQHEPIRTTSASHNYNPQGPGPGHQPNPGPPTQPNQPNQPNVSPGADREQEGVLDKIQQLGTPNVPQMQSNIHCLNIIGQIEGHVQLPPQNKTTKYEHVIPQLVAAEQNQNIEGVLVILNTVGGDVEGGLAIAEMISTLSKPCVALVLGGGHSIGVPIAVGAQYSFIAESATMTIHPVRLSGLVIGVPQTFEYLERMQDRVVSFVTRHSNISEEKFKELMFTTDQLARDIGTNVDGVHAVNYGLIDEVGGMGQALQKLNQLMEARKQQSGQPVEQAQAQPDPSSPSVQNNTEGGQRGWIQ